jgi:hypothetical protein
MALCNCYIVSKYASDIILAPKKIRPNSVDLVCERTMLTEQPPLVSELSANFADRGCHVVSIRDPHSRILGFLDRIIVAPCCMNFTINTWHFSAWLVNAACSSTVLIALWFQQLQIKPVSITCFSYSVIETLIAVFVVLL